MSDGSGPPVLIGEKVWWLGSGSGLPKPGVVRWIGRLPEIGPDWALGIELEEGLPYGGIDGTWRGRQLFKCRPKHGLIVPSDKVMSKQGSLGSSSAGSKNDVSLSLLPLQNQVSAPPRLRRSYHERNLLLDRHRDFHSVHLEAVQIRRRIQEDQVVSLVLGQSSTSAEDVLSRGMIRNEVAVVPRARRTESLAARKEKTNSGLFSFLRWFRKENKTGRREERSSFSNPSSPVLKRSDSAITGSVDTLFSTATATSFSFVRPESYRPFGEANEPRKWIFPGPETNTYRNRIRRREELKNLDQNLSLREKYNLYASGSLERSLDDIFDDRSRDSLDRLQPLESCTSTLARKKRKAPEPPPRRESLESPSCDSLPTTLSKESLEDFKLHRRTVSESAKYKRKPFHIKGKRKAPPPPRTRSREREDFSHANTLRKKRKAPPPPIEIQNVVNIPKETSLDIIKNEKLKNKGNESERGASTSQVAVQEVEIPSSTDTLRLERGMLKPNKMDSNYSSVETRQAPTSPVSPRPWYKRPQSTALASKHSDGKKKENKSIEDWMLESGFPRRSQGLLGDSKFKIFNKTDKAEDKRRSQISILTNISELDREAAEIIQRGKEREKSLLASYNAKYYVNSENGESGQSRDEGSQTDAVPKKATAKELITLFNSITNLSRVTLNSNYVAKEDVVIRQSKTKLSEDEIKLKRNSSADMRSYEIDIESPKLVMNGNAKDRQIAGPSRASIAAGSSKKRESFHVPRRQLSTDESRISRVTIEELDEYDSEKSHSSEIVDDHKDSKQGTTVIVEEETESPVKSSSGSTICSSLLNDSSGSISSGSSSGTKLNSSKLFSNYAVQKKLSVWLCSQCTLENPRWRLTCEACDMWRPTICDYTLCKKTASLDEEEQSKTDNANVKKEKVIDDKTSDLIRNGQILGSLSASKRLINSKEGNSSKKPLSPKAVKKETNDICVGKKSELVNGISDEVKIDAKTEIPTEAQNGDSEQAEVVRKARLAFFSKNDSSLEKQENLSNDIAPVNYTESINKPSTNEKVNLRDLLKEMKNSLPKQKKLLNPTTTTSESSTKDINEPKRNHPPMVKQTSLNECSTNSSESNNCDLGMMKYKSRQKSFEEYDRKHVQGEQTKKSNAVEKILSVLDNASLEVKPRNVPEKYQNGDLAGSVATKDQLGSKTINTTKVDNTSAKSTEIAKPISPPKNLEPNIKKVDNINSNQASQSNHSECSVETENVLNEKKAEAIFVKSEIIIEDIKFKRKPDKVSSSAQTNTKVLSLDLDTVRSQEKVLPVTVEEYIVNNGSLASSSVRTEPMKVDVQKFEMMRPRDFTKLSESDASSSSKNNLHQSETLSTSSSFSSSLEFNLPPDPTPGPSTAKDDGGGYSSVGTMALNRLLKRLEGAISSGQHDAAARLAKELAKLRIPCSVVRHSPTPANSSDTLMKVIIEDKTSQRAPISLRVKPWVKLIDLKRKMEKEEDIPVNLQRWFIDKKLASDDQANIKQMGIEGPSTPVFLYLITAGNVENQTSFELPTSKSKILNTATSDDSDLRTPTDELYSTATLPSNQVLVRKHDLFRGEKCEEKVSNEICNKNASCSNSEEILVKHDLNNLHKEVKQTFEPRPSTSSQVVDKEREENYKRLVDLEKDELVLSVVTFECPVCFTECKPPEGVVLKECLHSFCKACLSKTVEYSEEAEIKCPFRDNTYTCDSTLLEREIKALVTAEVYEDHLAKSIAQAETSIANAFHCKTPDCKGWCIYEDNVNLFKCPVCLHANCLTCQAIHEGLDCKQYQEQLNQESEINQDAKRTKDMLQEMVDRGEAMPCPRCKVVLMKKWGCDWLRCSMCKTEICWVTRGPRWGPNGKGDTSGGCQCGVNGVKCHPKCNYCH